MNTLVPIMLFGWVPVTLLLFALLPPRRAVLTSYVGAWLLLPQAGLTFPGLPDFTKMTAAGVSVALGIALFDAGRVVRYRPSWVDLPIAVWCVAPFLSSVSNRLGWYDGLSGIADQLVTWGIPWLVGRLYLDRPEALRDLAVAILVGGLLYVPLCLWEIRMSPQLHRMLYGFHPTHFMMTRRFGGYRPMVFMSHGLMLGLWMTSASLLAIWLWRTGSVRQLLGLPMSLLAPVLLVTTVLCKSAGALVLLVGGLGVLFVTRTMRRPAVILCAVAAAPLYMTIRANEVSDLGAVVSLAAGIDEDRAASLAGRLENETLIVQRAMRRPAFGWGSSGDWRVRDETGRDITVSDGLWVITLGKTGLTGLLAMTATILLPVLLLLRRVPASAWGHPAAAPASALALLLVLYAIDNLLNAMLNPIYLLAAGGLSGLYVLGRRAFEPAREPAPGRRATLEGVPARARPGFGGVRPAAASHGVRSGVTAGPARGEAEASSGTQEVIP